ncbi:MAG TPA: RNA methyltransferase [Thermomicrobiaceae bacterium]|nr:RNA methyltransferase [Thermomicrobiaceae bacterium]
MEREDRPITQRRRQRMRDVLARRQPDLTVVIENVHDPHNISAVLRSCEAVGVPAVHLVYTVEARPELSRITSASALKWLEVVHHPDIPACYAALRAGGFTIYATHLGVASRDLYDLDLTAPVALVFGNEQRGVTDEALAGADGSVVIPMMGMVRSLNISVACAVSLYEALRQRRAAGAYDRARLPEAEIEERLIGWLQRERRLLE